METDTNHEELTAYIYDDGPYSNFLDCGLKQIFTARTGQVFASHSKFVFDPHFRQRVLDSVEGGDDPCTC